MTLGICKIRDGVERPTQAYEDDVGIDFYNPEQVELQPGEIKAVPLGFKVAVPRNHFLWLCDKSGTVLKKGITVHAGTIDPGYRGEIHAIVQNAMLTEITTIMAGEKICQGILIQARSNIIMTDLTKEQLGDTHRGEKGLGSSGA